MIAISEDATHTVIAADVPGGLFKQSDAAIELLGELKNPNTGRRTRSELFSLSNFVRKIDL